MNRTFLLAAAALSALACSSRPTPGAGGSGGTTTGSGGGGAPSGSTVTFSPAPLAQGLPDLTNPLRGQYQWLGVPAYPSGWIDVDGYQRWSWAQVEPTHGAYAWSLIDAEIAAAKARHGRFGFRVMPLCQGCADHTYKGGLTSIPDDLADVANPLFGSAPGETDVYLIPDWNSDAYLSRLEELLNAIGARYHDEPTLAWMDVSSYGNWGEFHLYPFNQPGGPYDHSTQQPITDANAQHIVDLNAAAFANKLLIVNSEQPAALARAVASTTPPIGLRVDCLGSDGLAGGEAAIDAVPGASDRWRTAPFITEWCQVNLGNSGADLFVQGEQQVRTFHISMLSSGNFTAKPTAGMEANAFQTANLEAGYRIRLDSLALTLDPTKPGSIAVHASWVDEGVAPTYLAWNVALRFVGPATVEAPLTVDLRKVQPDAPLADDEQVAVVLTAGTYQVSLHVDDAQAISPPMSLAMEGRAADGSYPLGSVTVP